MTPDARLLRGDYRDPKFTPDKKYLTEYFCSELSICFVKYYLEFEDIRKLVSVREFFSLFTDHTGHDCQQSHKYYLFNKITELVEVESRAVENFDVKTLSAIREGKYRFKCKF